jgi:hypothetical protein
MAEQQVLVAKSCVGKGRSFPITGLQKLRDRANVKGLSTDVIGGTGFEIEMFE